MERLFVTRKRTGLGSDLISIVGAHYYARKTGRNLVIDWRNSRYLQTKSISAFNLLFKPMREINSVTVLHDERDLDENNYPKPIAHLEGLEPKAFHTIINKGIDLKAPTIICTKPMHHLPDACEQRSILSQITPIDSIISLILEFKQQHFNFGPVVGIHIRHGNGENLGFGRDDLINQGYDNIVDACIRIVTKFDFKDPSIFVCTDSWQLEQAFKNRYPRTITYYKNLDQQTFGPLHTDRYGLDGAYHAIAEMFLLRYCDTLLFNRSWFSHYARIMGDFHVPPVDLTPECLYGSKELYNKMYGLNLS